MPIYEYDCTKCGHRFEKIQQYSDPLEKKCPKCGGKLEQVITAASVRFKGSGWYATDYAKKGSGASSSKDEGGGDSAKLVETAAEKSSDSKSESKSESKSGTKSESKSDSKPQKKK